MDPITTSQALRIIAQKIELSHSPSISIVASELEQVLQYIESGDVRVAGEDVRVAGPVKWMKGLKRKLLNTKGTKKILDRIDNLESLMKWTKSVSKKVRSGDDIQDIASDDDFIKVLEGVSKLVSGGSEELDNFADTEADASAIEELDDFWSDDEDAEVKDREIISDALVEFHSNCKERILKNKKLLTKQEINQKKDFPESKGKKKKEKDSEKKKSRKKSESEPESEPESKKKSKKSEPDSDFDYSGSD